MTPAPGSRVAHYEIERRLGSGGMGDVYLAVDTNLHRRVAIKFLSAHTDAQARKRLLREARAVAALDHPGICSIYEVGADPAGGDFIVMQYLEGDTLAVRLTNGRLPAHESLGIAGQIAEALVAAHRQGLVHRDLKPQNIIITSSGITKLLDFGLAVHVRATTGAANALTTSGVTAANEVVGTPPYMAPEQIRNEAADFRSDLFSLGCVLYECLTGRRAFSGATTAELFGQILHVDPPAPSSLAPGMNSTHDALCERLLHKLPAERFQSAEEVVGAIRALTPSTRFGSIVTPVVVARSRSRMRILAGLVAGIVVLSSAGLWLANRPRSLPPPPADALSWYNRGVDAMRDGTYASARAAFGEAIRHFPNYVQAHMRLAEAGDALNDEQRARDELLMVSGLVPDPSRLNVDDQLRLQSARALVLRDYEQAVDGYRKLAVRNPNDAGAWLDLGRAEEAARKLDGARTDYAKAVSLDRQNAAAHLRLGVLQFRSATAKDKADGLVSLDEAARLYRAASKPEGEAEAMLRKGVAFSGAQDPRAREVLDRVMQMTTEPQFISQRVRAEFELARVNTSNGRFDEAEASARQAVTDAISADMQPLAASALITVGLALSAKHRYEDADAQLARAIALATEKGAKRIEMQARLQQASLRLLTGAYQDALTLSEIPRRHFADTHDGRLENDAKAIASQAHEGLEHYDEAAALAREVLAFAEAARDNGALGNALENLAGIAAKLGRLPEALQYRERLEDLHRRLKSGALAFDLTNHARLLVMLGRARDADALLAEVDREIAAKNPAYLPRRTVVAALRVLSASTVRQFAGVSSLAASVEPGAAQPAGVLSETQRLTRALREHALAELGQSRRPLATIAGWVDESPAGPDRREVSYWVAATLVARGSAALAARVSSNALASFGPQGNPELEWRLAAIAASAATSARDNATFASMSARAQTAARQIETGWGAAAADYFARPDLAALRRNIK